MGVIPRYVGDHFQLRVRCAEMPRDGATQIRFPDIENPAHRAEHVGALEPRIAGSQVIEMPLRAGPGIISLASGIGGQGILAIGFLVEGHQRIHALIARPGSQRACR